VQRLFAREPAYEQVAALARQERRRTAAAPASCETLILDLQAAGGNSAVARLVAREGGPVPPSRIPGGALLQRSSAFGLATPRATTEFAQTAVKWWRKYPATTLGDFAVIMVEEASSRLEKIGVPAVEPDDASTTSVGVFHSSTWTISLNVEKGTGHPPTTKIGDLKPEELADFADTFFHEARHAEQRFLMARLAVSKSKGKDAKAIAAAVSIKESVAAAAIKAGPLSSAEKAKAEQLSEFVDKHLGYKMWNNGLRDSASELVESLPSPTPSGVDSITAAWNALAPKVEELRKAVPWAEKRIESLLKLKRGAVDEQVFRDVGKTLKVLQNALDKAKILANVVAEWPKMKASQTITVDVAKRVQRVFSLQWLEFEVAARDVHLTAEAAYHRYPEEADARAVGSAVAAATRREAKAAKKRPAKRPKAPAVTR
jgi:hypothetical protein